VNFLQSRVTRRCTRSSVQICGRLNKYWDTKPSVCEIGGGSTSAGSVGRVAGGGKFSVEQGVEDDTWFGVRCTARVFRMGSF